MGSRDEGEKGCLLLFPSSFANVKDGTTLRYVCETVQSIPIFSFDIFPVLEVETKGQVPLSPLGSHESVMRDQALSAPTPTGAAFPS